MRTFKFLITVILTCCGSAAIASDSSRSSSWSGPVDIEVVFSDEEIRIIRSHYQSAGGNRGKSRGKNKDLPPGIAKNLARGKPLPPGLAKRPLPRDLIDTLPPAKHGYERVIVAGKVLLIEVATQVVRDVLTDVLID